MGLYEAFDHHLDKHLSRARWRKANHACEFPACALPFASSTWIIFWRWPVVLSLLLSLLLSTVALDSVSANAGCLCRRVMKKLSASSVSNSGSGHPFAYVRLEQHGDQ